MEWEGGNVDRHRLCRVSENMLVHQGGSMLEKAPPQGVEHHTSVIAPSLREAELGILHEGARGARVSVARDLGANRAATIKTDVRQMWPRIWR